MKFNFKSQILVIFHLIVFFALSFPGISFGAEKLYFLALVEKDDMDKLRIILEWEAVEGSIPQNITAFRLYRSVNTGNGYGDYKELALPKAAFYPDGSPAVQGQENLQDRILESATARRFDSLIQTLILWGLDADAGNFHKRLFPVLNPDSAGYDSLRRMLMIRRFPGVAVASSLGYVDTDIDLNSKYKYLLSVVKADGTQILPAGQTAEISPNTLTMLPEPQNFRQVLVSASNDNCSEYDKNLDDNLIHMTWDIPATPQEIGLQIMTSGYDIFWAKANDAGPINSIDARDTKAIDSLIMTGKLHRFNQFPIFVSGPASPEGRESYLVKDDGQTHDTWTRGDRFRYYLAAIDIAGHYSAGKLVEIEGLSPDPEKWAQVIDMQAPPAPWNIRTREAAADLDTPPRLFLEWETITKNSWLKNYGQKRQICGGDDQGVCYALGGDGCSGDGKKFCVDLDIAGYIVYRFNSPQQASQGGNDFDGDGWPDQIEKDAETNPCSKISRPPGQPPLVSALDPYDSGKGAVPHDPEGEITAVEILESPNLNKVYWFRVAAVDSDGNSSMLSPPVRVVLPDRTQPENGSYLARENCVFSAEYSTQCQSSIPDPIMTIMVNASAENSAASFALYHYQEDFDGEKRYRFIGKQAIHGNEIAVRPSFFMNCGPIDCPKGSICGYVIRFLDDRQRLVLESEPFHTYDEFSSAPPDFCEGFHGCITFTKLSCDLEEIPPADSNGSEGDIYFCPEFSDEFETARLYMKINGKMSPFLTLENNSGCKQIYGLNAIVPDNICLGSRIFSRNHVGSKMKYFGCLTMNALTPSGAGEWISPDPFPSPKIDEIQALEDGENKFFRIFWTCQTEGIAAFPVRLTHNETLYYETSFNLEKDNQGRFFYDFFLRDDRDLNLKWYVSVRAVDLTMKASNWSQEKSASWDESLMMQAQVKKVLPWPAVDLPAISSELMTAFIIRDTSADSPLAEIPAIVVSDDLFTLELAKPCDRLPSYLKEEYSCTGGECLRDGAVIFGDCPLCPILAGHLKMGSFIVFRQAQGKNFVQVSPLLEKVHCYAEDGQAVMQDPYIFLRYFEDDAITGIDTDAVNKDLIRGLRLVFADRYPRSASARLRYKILAVNQNTGEIQRIYTTNWIE